MKKLLLLTLFFWSGFSFADQQKFCAGFEEGFKIIMGDTAYMPSCYFSYQMPPADSTYFREGVKAGMNVGKSQQSSTKYKPLRESRGGISRDNRDRY
jgi:hypothetical protein